MSYSGYDLHWIVGPNPGKVIQLKPGLLCIGRGQEGEKRFGWLLLPDPTVSRHHANLRWSPSKSKFFYEHLSKTNPTLVNGRLVNEDVPLGNQAQLGIGLSQFVLRRNRIQLGNAGTPAQGNHKAVTEEVDPADHFIQVLPNGFRERLNRLQSSRIGLNSCILWIPQKARYVLNTNGDKNVWISRTSPGRVENHQVDKPIELMDGDVVTLDFCQYQYSIARPTPKISEPGKDSLSPSNPAGYQKLQSIGRGASSEVFLMENGKGNKLAGKFLLHHLAHNERALMRFEREAKVALTLDHPRLLKVYHQGVTPEGARYILTEYLGGGTFEDRLKTQGPIPKEEVATLAQDIAEGLDYLHARDLVHRDIKPSNLFFKHGRAVIADFGIVRGVDMNTATETGFTTGTPHYMSPEHFRGYTEPRSDQYALALVLYELLTGEKLFDADDPIALAFMHVHQEPDFSQLQFLPRQAVEILSRMLSKQSGARFDTVREAARWFSQSLA